MSQKSGGAEFCENQKRLGHSLTFTLLPQAVYQISENALRTDRQMDGRTDENEIIGQSGQISGRKIWFVQGPKLMQVTHQQQARSFLQTWSRNMIQPV